MRVALLRMTHILGIIELETRVETPVASVEEEAMTSPRFRPILSTAAISALFVALAAAPSGAAPIAYAEEVSGDLPERLPADTIFTFDVGLNTVDGHTVSLPFGPFPAFDLDSFAFEVPTGTRLVQVSYSFIVSLNAGTVQALTQFTLDRGNAFPGFPPLDVVNVDLLGANAISLLEGSLPLPSGVYGLQNSALVVGGAPGELTPGWSAANRWEFLVVPEPPVFSLFVSGLAVLGMRRRMQAFRKAS